MSVYSGVENSFLCRVPQKILIKGVSNKWQRSIVPCIFGYLWSTFIVGKVIDCCFIPVLESIFVAVPHARPAGKVDDVFSSSLTDPLVRIVIAHPLVILVNTGLEPINVKLVYWILQLFSEGSLISCIVEHFDDVDLLINGNPSRNIV